MKIVPVNPEIISTDDYRPTDIENLFLHATDGTAVIVGYDVAYRITATK